MSKKQDIALLLARLVLGIILVAHAVTALRGSNPMPFSGVDNLGLPHWTADVAIWIELGSGILILLGKFTAVAAVLVMIHMLLGVRVHWHQGFLYGTDFPLALVALACVLVVFGPGKYALESFRKA
jgi:putative oxidoreductase